ncbi:UNVERIFIED_CONTAM: hypothetical protein GTU68_032145 [Idotea baltica]|nr:hypothetical protein [Idotea baltica]
MNTSSPLPNRITNLLSELSLEEKIGQMTQLTITSLIEMNGEQALRPIRFKDDVMKEAFGTYRIGSVLNVPAAGIGPAEWQAMIETLQAKAKKNGTHIPVLYGVDSIHGASYTYGATFFPQQIGMAATRNRELVEELGRITAYETRASGIPWNFSPVVDIARNPLWPRMWEGFGEDVHLCSALGISLTQGYQGENIGDPTRVAACLKHYLGYGHPLSGMDRTPAWIPERFLREYYLPPFKAAIDAGAATIMINSGEINGIPVHADPFILTDILRGELGFEGVAVTDWQDIIYLHTTHRISHNNRESVKKAVLAGIDMSMVPWGFSFSKDLISLVNDGEIPMDRIDEAVGRILKLKADLGLLDETLSFEYEKFGSAEHHAAAITCTQESIVLLKNDGILPLPHSKKILITGMASNSVKILNGGWSHTWQGHDSSVDNPQGKSILTAFQELLGRDKISFAQGTFFDEEADSQAAIELAKEADFIVACVGESPYTENPGNIFDLNLPKIQKEFVQQLAKTGKPLILVLIEGRPRIIREIEPLASAVVMGFLPGDFGGQAIAEVIMGKVNPSGKMPFTYPQYVNNFINYDHKFSDKGHLDTDDEYYVPQFPFGHGLSYTTFTYSHLSTDKTIIDTQGESLTISVKVTNSGNRAGKECVELYIRDEVASISPPVKRLRGFEKIELDPGESQTVQFTISALDLAFVGIDNQWITEPGQFTVMVNQLNTSFEVI